MMTLFTEVMESNFSVLEQQLRYLDKTRKEWNNVTIFNHIT